MGVLYKVESHVAVVMLNRPESMNAIDPETAAELREIWRRIAADGDVRCVILTAAGERAFCTGSDLKKTMPPKEGVAELSFGAKTTPHLLANMELVKVPIICALNGYAVGGGLELALACDIRIASENASFAESFVKVGIVPGDGGAWLLPRAVGASRAAEMAFTGDTLNAQQALAIGLVSQVVPAAELLNAARELASRIVRNSGPALRMTKRLLREAQTARLDTVLEMSATMQAIAHKTPQNREAVQAFIEKRAPKFSD